MTIGGFKSKPIRANILGMFVLVPSSRIFMHVALLLLLAIVGCSGEFESKAPLKVELKDGIYVDIRSGEPYTGIYKEFYDSGEILSEVQFKDGQKNGKFTKWWKNGKRQREGGYKAGALSGRVLSWYESGKLSSKEKFESGRQVGVSTKWSDSGVEVEKTYRGVETQSSTSLMIGQKSVPTTDPKAAEQKRLKRESQKNRVKYVSAIGTWTGPMKNSKGGSAQTELIITKETKGIIEGTWHAGWPLENGTREDDIITWRHTGIGKGCRDYNIFMKLEGDGAVASLSYEVINKCDSVKNYNGTAKLSKK